MRLSTTDSSGLSAAGNNVFGGSNSFNGPLSYPSRQTFSASGTISATGATVCEFTGSASGQTLNLPAAPTVGLTFVIVNNNSLAVTLNGNGATIRTSSTVSVPPGGGLTVTWQGAQWDVVSGNMVQLTSAGNTWLLGQTFSSTLTTSSTMLINGRVAINIQRFSQNGATIGTISASSTSAWISHVTGSTGGTLNLPSSGLLGNQVVIVKNAGSASITLSGNGANIDGSASVAMAAGACRWCRWDGTNWSIVGGYL